MTSSQQNDDSTRIMDFLVKMGYRAIPIQENIAGHLLIEVHINEKKGLFILDTGAGGTVIDSRMAEELELILQKENSNRSGAGAGGLGLEVTPSGGNKLAIGNFIVHDFTVSIMSLEHVSQSLAQVGANEEILGVIGVDILKPAKAIIDYNNMILYLMNSDNFESINQQEQ